jgi:acetyl-CoA acetyltransferase
MHAAALVAAGLCRHVLCVCGDNRLSGMTRDQAVAALAEVGHAEFERPYGIGVPPAYALVAQRYMHDFGVTSEHLAGVAVAHRAHAMRHPKAQMRTPITLDDVANSKPIATPLRLLDCCVISDGAAAVVVSAADAARDTARRSIDVLGTGQMNTHEHIVAAPSLTDFGCKQSAAQAFARAGVTARDIDVAEIYDSFTITLLAELESIGFFARGAAGPAILGGALDLAGALPCNTHGGLLSYAHSGAAGGMFHVVEAVRQLRREAEGRQVADPELAFVHGDGGILSAHCSLVLGRH